MCCVIQQRGNPVIQLKIRKDLVLFGVGSAHIHHIRTAGPAVQRPVSVHSPPGPWSVWTTETLLSDADRSRLDGCMEKFDDGQQQFFTHRKKPSGSAINVSEPFKGNKSIRVEHSSRRRVQEFL